jgi:hypothetical protein
MSHARLAALALAATTLAAAGCGGSSSSNALTHSQLVAKAEPICAQANSKLNSAMAVTDQIDVPSAAAEAATYEQQVSAELAKLIPPASMSNDWKVIVTSYKTVGNDLAKLGEAAKAKDKPNPALIIEFTNSQQRRASAATHEGLSECARY